MLRSLFGELDIANRRSGVLPRASGSVESDDGFAATAILENSASEVNDQGQIVDRHLRDLFVTGSPALAMREHFASSRAELDDASKWIVLLDPARIWAGAVVKSMSDASGQPIERLHLREQGTLRTLALIERTTIRRRQSEMLKVFHADVRASGRENAEISLALMERSHMTAVVVGPMQPHAIDAMLNTLHEAASQSGWHCPSLLFLLPPAAVWIANKIGGIAWPRALDVRILNEPLTSASAVWNAVLGTWNRVKDEPPAGLPKRAGDDLPLELAEWSPPNAYGGSDGPIAIGPVEASAEARAAPSRRAASIDPRRATRALAELLRTDGLLACSLVDSVSGLVLASEQRDALGAGPDIAAAAAAQALRAHRLAARSTGLVDPIEELIVSAGMRQQVLRVLARRPEFFMVVLLDKSRTSLALARLKLLEAEKNLL